MKESVKQIKDKALWRDLTVTQRGASCGKKPRVHKAQGMLEYAVFLSVVLCALVIMQFIIKRGYQGKIRQDADSVGTSYSPGHTDIESVMTTSSRTHSFVSGTIPGGDPLLDAGADTRVEDGMSVALTRAASTIYKREVVDFIKNED